MTTVDPIPTPLPIPLINAAGFSFAQENQKILARKVKVTDMLAQVQQLHAQINTTLHKVPASERPLINNSTVAAELLTPFLGHLDHEEFWVIVLDGRNRALQLVKLYEGSINSIDIRTNEVFRQAIIEQAPAVILAHNHPSDDPSPSPNDIAMTQSVVQAGRLLDVLVVDHIIVCNNSHESLKGTTHCFT